MFKAFVGGVQITKEGNFHEEKNWQHAVDVEVFVNDGKVKELKSRFGKKLEVGLWLLNIKILVNLWKIFKHSLNGSKQTFS